MHGLAITCRLSVRLSVCLSMTLVDHDCIGWKSWKLIARTISSTSSLFVAQRSSTYSQGNMEKFWGANVRSTPTSITSGWTESTESHVILGGGVDVCLLLSAHRAVIFAIAQLSCFHLRSSYPDRKKSTPKVTRFIRNMASVTAMIMHFLVLEFHRPHWRP